MRVEFGRAVGRQTVLDEFAEGRTDLVRVLPMHQPEGNFRGGLRGDDGLEALPL